MSQQQKILVVDDQPTNIRILGELLQDDYQVFFAMNGADAVALAETQLPDLILLDIMMPGMDGREVCRHLKARTQTSDIPVVFLTALTSDLEEIMGLELGAVDYISKPINPALLKLRVKNQLELKQHRDQLEALVKQRTAELTLARDEARAREFEAREGELLLWTILESSLDAFVMTNQQGKIIDFNPSAEKLFGYKRVDVVGADISEVIIPPKLREKHRQALRRTQEKNVEKWMPIKRRMSSEGLRADGNMIDLEVALSSVISHGQPVYTAFLRDLTSTKQLLIALNSALSVAESSSRSKDMFLANMSHEIRTPMNGVLGMIDLALRANPSPEVRNFLVQAKSSSHLLLRVINDILDFAKIEAGKMEMESADFYLGDVLEDAVNLFRNMATGRDVELVVSAPPNSLGVLVGDRLRIQQILINLTGNAIKFTKKGEIHIQVVLVEQTEERVSLEFAIRDTGIGLSKEQITRLFSPFVQAESRTARQFGGTGLGLTICKRLVKRMGGKIWVKSVLNVGSAFYFTLDLRCHRLAKPYAPIVDEEIRQLKTLVVDNNASAKTVMLEILNNFGMEAIAVESGKEALVALQAASEKELPYALVLLDRFMPEMDGIETAKNILDAHGTHPCPLKIILMTPFSAEDITQKIKRIGVDACLFKPVTPSLLLDTLLDVYGKTVTRGFDAQAKGLDQSTLTQKLGGTSMLLVDDNTINQQVAREILVSVGVHVTLANNGLEAVDIVQNKRFDLVLMDVQMPIMDGYKATRTLRKIQCFKDLPIIAMTANALAGDRENCLASGMNDYVAKPIDLDQLFAVLLKWVGRPESREDRPREDRPREHRSNDNREQDSKDVLQQEKEVSTAETEIYLPEELQSINWADGLRRVCGNRALMKKIIVGFCEAHVNTGKELQAMLEKDDFNGAERKIHTIKGSAGNISAMHLHQLSKTVEHAIKAREMEKLDALWRPFTQELQKVILVADILKSDVSLQEDFVSVGSQETEQETSGGDERLPESIRADLVRLSDLLKSRSLSSEEVFETLKRALQGFNLEQELTEMDIMIRQYYFSQASERLHQLAEKLGVSL